jgi:hypothetical protein
MDHETHESENWRFVANTEVSYPKLLYVEDSILKYFDLLYGILHLNTRRVSNSVWNRWITRRNKIVQKWMYLDDVKQCVKLPFFKNIQVYLKRVSIPRSPLLDLHLIGSRFVFITVYSSGVKIMINKLVNLIYLYCGRCEQNINHTHIIMGFSYPKNHEIIKKCISFDGQNSLPIHVESIYKSVPAAHQYIKNQIYNTETITYKISPGWKSQKHYVSFISERTGPEVGREFEKADQHDLPYHCDFHRFYYDTINHPQRWSLSSFVYLKVDVSELRRTRNYLVALYFNSVRDIYVYDDENSIIWNAPNYRYEPIIIITSKTLTQFPIVRENPPFIVVLEGTYLADSGMVPFRYFQITDVNILTRYPLESLLLADVRKTDV